MASYHPKILAIDTALLRAKDSDPDVAQLVARGERMWHDGCRRIVQGLADEGRLAEPWTVEAAADLLWSFMFPETLARLTGERRWSIDDYRERLTTLLRRTLVSAPAQPARRG